MPASCLVPPVRSKVEPQLLINASNYFTAHLPRLTQMNTSQLSQESTREEDAHTVIAALLFYHRQNMSNLM